MNELEPILPRIAAGDLSAVQLCMHRYNGLIWSLARRLLRGVSEAEDAVQEVYVALWKNADRFDASVASEATFVAMITRRRLIDFKRRRDRRAGETTAHPLDEVDVAEPQPEQSAAEVAEEAALAARAINMLRPEQQAVLKLAVYEELSHQQIADSLHMPLGTVKTHVRRGLRRVRELLGDGDGAERPDG